VVRRATTLAVVLALVVVAGCTSAGDDAAAPAPSPGSTVAATVPPVERAATPSAEPKPRDDRPNIVLITTDDMNQSDLRWMPKTRRLLGGAGVTVDGFISNHPLCCPARAQIFTGQFAHNNRVHDNQYSRFGGYKRLEDPGQHVGRWLRDAGYRTAFVGKHMNGWEFTAPRQPGWTVFDPLLTGIYAPYGITMFGNGTPRRYEDVYTADLVGRLAVRYIKRFAARDAPFFVWVSQMPPHGMFVDDRWTLPVPARRHEGRYADAVPPSLSHPAFNEADISDKPPWMRDIGPARAEDVTAWHRARVESLAAVDDQVARTVAALRETGELDNTYLFFTSDNGLMLGEHRLWNKNKPYEPNLRIPLLVRGPTLPAGARRTATYGLVDLAPTFLDLGEAEAGLVVDGRSMMGTLRADAPSYPDYLIQAAGGDLRPPPGTVDKPWWWRGIRSSDYVYVRYNDGFEELYDMQADPGQLTNVASLPEYADVKRQYADRLKSLKRCAGEECRR
jgi:arylsulfatase A-like enzyme